MNVTRHAAVARLSVCILAILSAGCGMNREDPAASRTDTVIVGVRDKVALLPDMSDAEFLIYSPFAVIGADGDPKPGLARSWDVSEGGRVRTWHLRDDVRWHDGEPLTAHDVKFTFDLLGQPDVAAFGPLDEVTVVDDFTVRISSFDHDYETDIVIYPKHLLDHLDPARIGQWEFWTRPVGSGPYRFVRYGADRFIEFEANPDYFKGKPRIDKVVLKFIGQAAVVEALAGNVDVVGLDTTAPTLKQDERFGIYYGVYAGAIALYLNHRHPLFSDSRVRRAVALAIDRFTILQTIGLPRDLPLTDVLFTLRQFRRRQLPSPLPYDPETARELIEQAGWGDADGDGVREKGGTEARFSLLPYRRTGREILIQDYLRRVGLAAEIHNVDGAVKGQRMEAGEFDAGVRVLQLNTDWRIRHFGENSIIGYENLRVAETLRRAAETADLDALDALYVGIQEEFTRDMPSVILQQFVTIHAVHKRIRGLDPDMFLSPTEQMADLWIETE